MELLLLRHGKAASHGHPDGDFARALVEEGHAQARHAARLLSAARRLPDLVLSSPVLRARQTAETFCATAGLDAPLIQPWLACGMRPAEAIAELAGFREFRRVLIVGHEPDFSSLLEWLLETGSGGIEVKKGALACIHCTPPAQGGHLVFLVPPAMIESRPTGIKTESP
ncbi:MAG: SixA phosphatase family protein [Luteolibacter sp.]|jgi:phosphohistidine phosphatase